MRNKRQMRRSQIIATAIGSVIVLTVVIGLIAPNALNNTATVDPNSVEIPPTNPPPLAPAAEDVEGAPPHINNTGLFQVFRPNGSAWALPPQDRYDPLQNRVNTIFTGNCAVIHAFVEVGANYVSLDSLSTDKFTDFYFDIEWSQYDSWELTSRQIADPYVIMDFKLTGNATTNVSCPRDYLGRQISWLGDGLIYNMRIVVRDEDPESLDRLEELTLPTFLVYPHLVTLLDNSWRARMNTTAGYMALTPLAWQPGTLIPGSDVAVESYNGSDVTQGYRLTMQTYENVPLVSMEEAQTWLETNFRSNITILSQETVEQQFGRGYRFSYSFQNADGDRFSAAAALLNDENGKLYVAELTAPNPNLDFLLAQPTNDVEGIGGSIIRSFTILAPPDVSTSS